MISFKLVSTGVANPAAKTHSSDLDRQLGLPVGTVEKRSGISYRLFAPHSVLQADLAAEAVRHALHRASLNLGDIDLLLSTSGVSQQALPSTAAAVAKSLGLVGVPAFDIGASCLGFMATLQVAGSLLASGQYRRIAVVASDIASRGLDWAHPEASYIFGDGAAAAILEPSTSLGFSGFALETYPEGFAYCEVRAGGTRRNPTVGLEPQDYLFRMDGKAVFRLAAKKLPDLLARVLAEAGCSLADLDAIVPHQASHLGMAHIIHRMGFDESRVINIYPTRGNQVSASIPTALHTALADGRIKAGHRILLLGTAAGFTAGAAVLTV